MKYYIGIAVAFIPWVLVVGIGIGYVIGRRSAESDTSVAAVLSTSTPLPLVTFVPPSTPTEQPTRAPTQQPSTATAILPTDTAQAPTDAAAATDTPQIPTREAPTEAPSATPPLPTATPVTAHELRDGDFEQTGDDETWQMIGGAHIASDPKIAHMGNGSALMGGDGVEDEGIQQRVLIPQDRPYMSYWDTTSSEYKSCDIDKGYIWADETPDDGTPSDKIVASVYDFCDNKSHSQWRHHTVDLRTYAGKEIQLRFTIGSDGIRTSYWSVDDVTFQAQP